MVDVQQVSGVFRGDRESEAARRAHEATVAAGRPARPASLDRKWLRELCLDTGADDAGFVEVDRIGLGDEGDNARRVFPSTRALISLVGISNREALRSTSRATANNAWRHTGAKLDAAAGELCERLAEVGVRAMPTAIGFPMDMEPEPGRAFWVLSHKTVAVEAGMGHIGVNRNVIHPRFGNFLLLETVLIDTEIDGYDEPLDYNPCMGCNLCVAACPVGAISNNGEFDFFACMSHNYREFPVVATDWLDAVAASDGDAYRAKFREGETRSMLHSLAFEPSYKSAYCMAVCPAGDDVITPYLTDRARFREDVLVPLIRHEESVYVQSGSRAEKVAMRNPSKHVRYLDFDPNVSTAANFALGLRHMFGAVGADAAPYRVAFRFPDGAFVATVAGGRVAIGPADDEPITATLTCDDVDYIAILHPDRPGRARRALPRYVVDGDDDAVRRLFACLG
jgi:ferredoxin